MNARELLHFALRTYLRHSPLRTGKERLLAALWQQLSTGKGFQPTRIKGTQIQVECDLSKWIQRHIYFLGEYEPESTAIWQQLARDATIIFDLGANIGIYSLLAADANPRAAIHSFEPTSELFDIFCANIQKNRMANIVANPLAVGARSETVFLNKCTGSDNANEGMNFVSANPVVASAPPIPQVCLDDYCEQRGIEGIDLLKMDIEGAEYDALCGAKGLLSSQRIGSIFFELSDWAAERAGHSMSDVPQMLREYGYELFTPFRGRLRPLALNSGPRDSVIARPAEGTTGPCKI